MIWEWLPIGIVALPLILVACALYEWWDYGRVTRQWEQAAKEHHEWGFARLPNGNLLVGNTVIHVDGSSVDLSPVADGGSCDAGGDAGGDCGGGGE